MNVIEIKDANFLVGKKGLSITLSDKSTLDMSAGEGVRIANKGGVPYIEYKSAGKSYQAKLTSSSDFKSLLEKVSHTSEYRTESVDLMDAIARGDITTEQLVDAFASVEESQKDRLNKTLTFVKRVATLNTEEKAKMLKNAPAILTESTEVTVTLITEGNKASDVGTDAGGEIVDPDDPTKAKKNEGKKSKKDDDDEDDEMEEGKDDDDDEDDIEEGKDDDDDDDDEVKEAAARYVRHLRRRLKETEDDDDMNDKDKKERVEKLKRRIREAEEDAGGTIIDPDKKDGVDKK